MSFLKYEFMQNAFIIGGLLAIILPLIGAVMVFKRLSMIGEALSHVSMAGVTLGLLMGFDPIIGAIVMSIIAALSIELIRKRINQYSELSIAIIMSAGVGLAGVLLGFLQNPANFNSFLFGSILAITQSEYWIAVILALIVMALSLIFYREFFYIAFDEASAKISGIKVNRMNILFTILTAITVSITSRIVGALIVSSLLVIPLTCGMQVSNSYKQTLFRSSLFSLFFVWGGLTISYYFPGGLKPGGTIVLLGVVTLIVILVFKSIKKTLH